MSEQAKQEEPKTENEQELSELSDEQLEEASGGAFALNAIAPNSLLGGKIMGYDNDEEEEVPLPLFSRTTKR